MMVVNKIFSLFVYPKIKTLIAKNKIKLCKALMVNVPFPAGRSEHIGTQTSNSNTKSKWTTRKLKDGHKKKFFLEARVVDM